MVRPLRQSGPLGHREPHLVATPAFLGRPGGRPVGGAFERVVHGALLRPSSAVWVRIAHRQTVVARLRLRAASGGTADDRHLPNGAGGRLGYGYRGLRDNEGG